MILSNKRKWNNFAADYVRIISRGFLSNQARWWSFVVQSGCSPRASAHNETDIVFTNAPCHRPLIRMLISYDGEMCNCCEDIAGAFQLGNIFEHTLELLWYAENHVKIVQDLRAGRRNLYPMCRNCPQAPSASSPVGARIEMKPRRYIEKFWVVVTGYIP